MAYDAREIFDKKLKEDTPQVVETKAALDDGVKQIVGNEILPNNVLNFNPNNWLKTDSNSVLTELEQKGGALWLANDGDCFYRFGKSEQAIKNTTGKAAIVLSNFLNKPITIFHGENPTIEKTELKLVSGDCFNPFKNEEFTEHNGVYSRNVWRPTEYMCSFATVRNEPKAILALIRHLCGGNGDYYDWFINWLALFFQSLERSHVALVLRGDQGAGKGVLFEQVLTPLFGKDFTVQINDKMLNSGFNGALLENKLFYNIDEVSHDVQSSKKVKNLLKALVTNSHLTLEKKYENTNKGTPIFGQVLITSNEPFALEIEPNDRRYTVFMTGKILSKANCLGYGTPSALILAIKKELKDFAAYLKCYNGNSTLFNTALNTKEKQALVNGTTDKFTLFANSIKSRDINFFDVISADSFLYQNLKSDFEKNRICKEDLKNLFEAVFGDEKITAQKLKTRLRAIEPHLFDDENLSVSNGRRYYKILS